MFVKKTPQPNDIVSFRLSSGEEVVGKLVTEDEDTVVLAKPISIGIQMVGKGQASIAFMPLMASVDDAGQLGFYKRNMVTVPTKSRADVEKSYIQATTGLAVPDAGTASSLLRP